MESEIDDDFVDDDEDDEEIVKKKPVKRTFKVKSPVETIKKSKSDADESLKSEDAEGTPKKKFK